MGKRPATDEFSPFYGGYIGLVPDGDEGEKLQEQLEEIKAFVQGITEDQGNYRYAAGKWSIKEVIGHITDNERIMSYRLLRIARGDRTSLPGYNQDEFMAGAPFDRLSLGELLDDFIAVRKATCSLIRSLAEETWDNRGFANDLEISARALIYVIIGHPIHHLNVIKERYLTAF
jgi:hypothetical protein